MKRIGLLAFMTVLCAAGNPDQAALKAAKSAVRDNVSRNRKYRKLQDKLNEFVLLWQEDCKSTGKVLRQSNADGLLSCQIAPPALPPQAPPPSTPSPSK